VPRHLSFQITILSLFLSLSLSLSLPPSLFLSLASKEGVRTLLTGQREREREIGRGHTLFTGQREREGKIESEKDGERVACMCISLFLSL